MPRLLRFYLENYCYFVSVKIYASKKIFQDEQIAELLVKVIFEVKRKLNFLLPAFVIMPEHLHLMIVPNKRNTISDVMRHIKGRFSRILCQGINSPDYEGESDCGVSVSEVRGFKKVVFSSNSDSSIVHKNGNSFCFRSSTNSPYFRGGKEPSCLRRAGNSSPFRRAGNSSQPEGKVCQDSFCDHAIRDEKDFLRRLKYVYDNPVRASLVKKAEDYKFLFMDKNLEKYL